MFVVHQMFSTNFLRKSFQAVVCCSEGDVPRAFTYRLYCQSSDTRNSRDQTNRDVEEAEAAPNKAFNNLAF